MSRPVHHLACALKCKQMYKKSSIVHVYGKQNVVAFSGTKSVVDLPINLQMLKTEDVHIGYKKYADMCLNMIDFSQLDTGRPITFTAHSIGCVAATIIASRLLHEMEIELVLFGSPKPGGKEFVDRMQCTIYNYMQENDPIQYFPLTLFQYYEPVSPYIILRACTKKKLIDNHRIHCYIAELLIDCGDSI